MQPFVAISGSRQLPLAFALSLAAIMAGGVAALGSGFPLAQNILALAGALWGLAAVWSFPTRGKELPFWALLLPVLAWGWLQTVPVTWVPWLFPWANPVWSQASAVLPVPGAAISLTPYLAGPILASVTAALLVATGAFLLARQPGADHLLLKTLSLTGITFAVLGLLTFTLGNKTILFIYPKPDYFQSLTGPFINRNTCATFMGLAMLASLAMGLYRVGEIPSARRAPLAERGKLMLRLVLQPNWPWSLGALICFVALLLTESRGGLISTMVGLATMIGALAVGARGARPFIALIAVAATAVMAPVMAVVAGGLGGRMGMLSTDAATRATMFDLTWEAFTLTPWLGTGLGSFESVFRTVRDLRIGPEQTLRIDAAHNTWLELLLTLGAPAAGLIVLAGLLAMGWMAWGVHTRRRGVVFPALGLGAAVLMLVHGYVDFSLQSPGFLTFAAALIGLCLATSLRAEDADAPRPSFYKANATRILQLGAGGLTVAAAAVFTWQSATLYGAAHTFRAWQEGQPIPATTLTQAIQTYHRAATHNPTWGREEAALLMAQLQNAPDAATATSLRQQLRQALTQTLGAAPADPYSWARFAMLNEEEGKPDDAQQAWIQSLLTGPYEGDLTALRIPALAAMLPSLPATDRALVQSHLQSLNNSRSFPVAKACEESRACKPSW